MFSTSWEPQQTTIIQYPTANVNLSPVPSQHFVDVSNGWSDVSSVDTNKTSDPAFGYKQDSIEEEISGQNLYKTELCRSFEETGACRYGSKCQFAHGRAELRPVLRHPKYKTQVCKTYHSTGTCPYGKRCRFIHSTMKPGTETKEFIQVNGAAEWRTNSSPCALSPSEIMDTDWNSPEVVQLVIPEISVAKTDSKRLSFFQSISRPESVAN